MHASNLSYINLVPKEKTLLKIGLRERNSKKKFRASSMYNIWYIHVCSNGFKWGGGDLPSHSSSEVQPPSSSTSSWNLSYLLPINTFVYTAKRQTIDIVSYSRNNTIAVIFNYNDFKNKLKCLFVHHSITIALRKWSIITKTSWSGCLLYGLHGCPHY